MSQNEKECKVESRTTMRNSTVLKVVKTNDNF